jgi:hypothetical protein
MLLYQPWNLLDLGESFGEGIMESSLAMPFIEALSITKAFFNEYRSICFGWFQHPLGDLLEELLCKPHNLTYVFLETLL